MSEPSAAQLTPSQVSTQPRIGFVLVDDHALVRQGLRALINAEPDLLVLGEGGGQQDALQIIEKTRPKMVIVDITLKEGDGLELLRQITDRWPDIRTLVISMHDESIYAERALRAGARGYIRKVDAAEIVVSAIRSVLAGDIYIRPAITSQILSRVVGMRDVGQDSPVERLTAREFQVLQSIGRGLSNREMAAEMGISVKTVETHREHIKSKLKLSSSGELLRYAIEFFRVAGNT